MNSRSRYTRDDRKQIAESIENLKNNEDYGAIFEILMDDTEKSYTQNSNGVFLNLSVVSDETLFKIKKYIKKLNKNKADNVEIDTDMIPNSNILDDDRTYKLTNYEKNIIKQRNLKKVLNGDDDDYEELRFSAKKKTATKPDKQSKSRSSKSRKTTKASRKEDY